MANIFKYFAPAPHIERKSDEEIKRKFPRFRVQVFVAGFLGYAGYYLIRSSNLGVVARDFQDALGYNDTAYGIIVMLTGLGYALGKFLMGNRSDRSDPRKYMAAGLVLTAACNFAFGGVQSNILWLHAGLWGLNGFVQGMGWAPGARAIGHWFSVRERGLALNSWGISSNVGATFIGWFAAWVSKPTATGLVGRLQSWAADTHGQGYVGSFASWAAATFNGWQNAFFLPGILALIIAYIVFRSLVDCPQTVGMPPVEEYKNDYTEEEKKHGLQERDLSTKELFVDMVLKNKFIWMLAFANFFAYVSRYGLLDWGPKFLREIKDADISQGGRVVMAIEFAGIPATILMGWLSDKLGGRRGMVSTLCMLPIIVAVFLLPKVPSDQLLLAIGLFAAVGFFVYPVLNLITTQAMDLTSKKAIGTAAGFIGLFGYLGGRTLLAPVLGRILDNYKAAGNPEAGWQMVFNIIIGCAVMGFILLSFTWKLKPKA